VRGRALPAGGAAARGARARVRAVAAAAPTDSARVDDAMDKLESLRVVHAPAPEPPAVTRKAAKPERIKAKAAQPRATKKKRAR
jgi:hypothetical protein